MSVETAREEFLAAAGAYERHLLSAQAVPPGKKGGPWPDMAARVREADHVAVLFRNWLAQVPRVEPPPPTPHPDLEWVCWCCLTCRQQQRSVQAIATQENTCHHVGTSFEKPFGIPGGEPSIYDIRDQEETRAWALARPNGCDE